MGPMTVLSPAARLNPELRKFTYRDLLEMERAGIIGEDEHIELLGGQIYKMTIKPPHAMAVSILVQRFSVAFDGKAQVIPQNPLRLSDDLDDTELPQPDVMLVKNQLYLDHPKPADVLLLVEVSGQYPDQRQNPEATPVCTSRHPGSVDCEPRAAPY